MLFRSFRYLRVRSWLSVAGALTFGFCPYVQYRLGGHQCLAAVYCIPLVLLLCLWCWEDPRFNRPGKGWAHYPRNWAALLFAFLIANNGIVYYGAAIGSENDVWYKNTAELDAGEMIAVLRETGFAGIYLDRDGFADTELEESLCHELSLDVPTLTSEDGKLIYLSLNTR